MKYVARYEDNGLEYNFSSDTLSDLADQLQSWYLELTMVPQVAMLVDDIIVIGEFIFDLYQHVPEEFGSQNRLEKG